MSCFCLPVDRTENAKFKKKALLFMTLNSQISVCGLFVFNCLATLTDKRAVNSFNSVLWRQ